jgi:hypothetical protein
MITDALLRVSNAQAVTTTAVSTDTVDLGTARDIGAGENLYMNFTVGTAFAGGTSTEFQVIGSASADLSSPTVLGSSGAIATAGLTAGKRAAVRVNPVIGSNGLRYFGARYVVVGTNSAGTVTADVVHGVQDQKSYASGFTVA